MKSFKKSPPCLQEKGSIWDRHFRNRIPTLNEAVNGNQLVYRKSHLRELEKEY